MRALILAGGRSRRLFPLTQNMPVSLLQLGDKPVINYLIEKCEALKEISDIYISIPENFKNQFEKWLSHSKFRKPIKFFIEEDGKEESAIAHLYEFHMKNPTKDDLLVIAGDNFFEFNIKDFLDFQKRKMTTVIALHNVKDVLLARNKYGVARVNINKRIIGFEEKPLDPAGTLISTACYVFKVHDIETIPKFLDEKIITGSLGYFFEWLYTKRDIYAYVFDSAWFDIGDFDSLNKAYEKVEAMHKNLLNQMLMEEQFDLRWTSCLKGHEKMVSEFSPVMGMNPLEKHDFENFVEEHFPLDYQKDINLVTNIAKALVEECSLKDQKQVVIVGKDIRAGTDFVVRSFINAILSYPNIEVFYVGEATTAYTAFCTNQIARERPVAFGVQLSASHTDWHLIGIEPQYGSIDSINKIPGSPFNAQDLENIRKRTIEIKETTVHSKSNGNYHDISQKMLHRYLSSCERIIRHIVGEVPISDSITMLIDTGNNVSRKFVEPLFDALGLPYRLINEEYKYVPDRVNDPNNPEVSDMMKDRFKLFDTFVIGTAFDTDADRSPFFDEEGTIIPGDHIASLIIQQMLNSKMNFVFAFETNNHIGAPILLDEEKKVVLGTVDAGFHLEEFNAIVKRSSIGKPFLFSKVSEELKGTTPAIVIPHTDGPLVSALVHMILLSHNTKEETITGRLAELVPSINRFRVRRGECDVSGLVTDSTSKSNREIKQIILDNAYKILSDKHPTERFDLSTLIVSTKETRVLIRASGHANYKFRISAESADEDNLSIFDDVKKVIEEASKSWT